MEKIYGCFYNRYSYCYIQRFEDFDPETEIRECCECVYDVDELDLDMFSNTESKIPLTTYLNTDFGWCELFKGGANVSRSS